MIIILGGSGYVGQEYQKLLIDKGIPYKSLKRSEVDYTNPAILTDVLRVTKAQFLINAAGYTGKPNVDACEINKSECLDGNASLPGRIAQACASAGIPWGHISSGCIYTGARNDSSGFTETDPPNFTFRQNNCSFYSGTKALGEEVLTSSPNIYIYGVYASHSITVRIREITSLSLCGMSVYWTLPTPFHNCESSFQHPGSAGKNERRLALIT